MLARKTGIIYSAADWLGVVQEERPDMEEEKAALVAGNTKNLNELKEIEDCC